MDISDGITPGFSLLIPNIVIEADSVIVRYVIKGSGSEIKMPGDDDVKRDVNLIRAALQIIVSSDIVLEQLSDMPKFRPTAGIGSRLRHIDDFGINRRIGCLTALLLGAENEIKGIAPSRDYALTAGHNVNEDDSIQINNQGRVQIGRVETKITQNVPVKNGTYVDAAVLSLDRDIILNENLKQSFEINGVRYFLSGLDSPEKGRVILRGIDQPNDENRGYVLHTSLNILYDPGYAERKLNVVQIARIHEDGNLSGSIHGEGESGMLGTYEPFENTEVRGVVMLIGTYQDTSIGVHLNRVHDLLSQKIPNLIFLANADQVHDA